MEFFFFRSTNTDFNHGTYFFEALVASIGSAVLKSKLSSEVV